MKRRTFINISALAPLLLRIDHPLFAQSEQPVSAVLARENINTFSQSADKLDKLRYAVASLRAQGFDKATSWFNMAAIHGIPSSDPNAAYVPAAIQALWGQCHNDESLFFLWHRAYVYAMERLMQNAVNDSMFRLPYWDWYANPSLPMAFRNEFVDAARTRKNSLYVADRNGGVNAGDDIWQPEVLARFGSNSFDAFQTSLNFAEHGEIHMAIGTSSNMGHPDTAARDPIFWLHHCNIDRLLPVWLKMSPVNRRPPASFSTWVPTVYRFPEAAGGTSTPSVSALALGSMQALGYEYAETGTPSAATPTLPAAPAVIDGVPGGTSGGRRIIGNRVEALTTKRAIEISGAGTIELPVTGGERNGLHALGVENVRQPFTSVAVVLDGIALREIPDGVLSYRVYLNLPSNTRDTKFDDHFLGNISLFALRHTPHHVVNAASQVRFSITDNLKRQMRSRELAPSSVQLSLVPVLAPRKSMPTRPVLAIGEIRVEATTAPLE